ncbi:MAG TPA: recombinase family protein [Acidimicrobiales bacterium]|nr:recombinase family protein [Acidimicrobiales bacterium]
MRVGIYARVSTEAQEAKGTIGSQLDALRARVAANGDELVTEFVDDGHSGARLDRPGLDAARDAAQAGTVEAIWCLSPDRLARSFAYQMLILDELARLGVTVCFTDSPPIDSDPQARLLVQVQGVIAEYERAKFSERERRGKMYRARAGEVLSHKVPYGYRRVPRSADRGPHVVVCEPEAAVVRRIFADYLGGATIRHLVVVLADDGVASPDGKAMWRLSSIFRVLRNEAYVGRLYWNRTHTSYDPAIGRDRLTRRPRQEWIEIPIPAIIDEGTFDAVQHAARDNTTYSRRRTETNTFLLRTLLRCDRCGVKLVCHRARRNEEVTRYYLCPHRDRVQAGGNDRRCSEPRIRADELDTFVFDQVRVLLTRPDLLAAGETAVVSGQPTPDDELLSAQLGHLQRRLEATAAERRRLADLYQAGIIDIADMTGRAAELDVRRRRLDDERDTLIAQRAALAQDNKLHKRIEAFATRAAAGIDRLDFDGRQQLLRLVLEDVKVQGWQVDLHLRIPLDDDPPAGPAIAMRASTARARRPRSPRGQPPKEAVSSNDGLRSIGQRPEERAERGGSEDPMAEHPSCAPRAQDVYVIDVRPPSHQGMDQRQNLGAR